MQPIPDDKQLARSEVAAQVFEEGDEIGRAHGAIDELEIEFPEGDPGHGRELVPGEAVLKNRSLASGRPGSHAMGPFADPGFVYENDGSALPGAVFFSAGQRFFFQCRMASSSRWAARPVGRWQEKFSPLSNRQTPDSEYCSPLIFSISRPTRRSVHRSVEYPCANAPASSAATTRFFSASVSAGGRPVCGALRSARTPFDLSALAQRPTEVRLTPSRRATSAGRTPRRNNRAPCKRRASSSARLGFFFMSPPLPAKSSRSNVEIVTVFIKGQ